VPDVAVNEPSALSVKALVKAFSYATEWLGVYVDEVNALNVYPVPDGDTGTNMHLTMQSVRRQLQQENPKTMDVFAHALAYGSLLGARGNSGVILSQILKGFAEATKGRSNLNVDGVKVTLESATKAAYAAVMKPVEGTILTVMRHASDGAKTSEAKSPLTVLKDAVAAGHDALEQTPDLLPMLKQAGVVDSGGLGLLRIFEGIIASFEDKPLPPPPTIDKRAQQQFEEEEFGFCTEFLLSDVEVPTTQIQELVAPFGDSLLVVGAEGYVKGHIHTEEPERLLATVARYGKMVRSKIEDMSEQHSEILAAVDMKEAEAPRTALVVVSDGYGVTKVFRSLKARVVGGGQTNNPSVQDIADAVRSVAAEDVIIMPNNKNIIMAAERVQEIIPEKSIHVLPTRTIGAGLAAAVMFDENQTADDLIEDMQESAEHALTLEVTTASRSTTIDDVSVNEGDYIGLVNDKLVVAEATPEACLIAMLAKVADDFEVGTLFYNTSVDQETLSVLSASLEEQFEDLELEYLSGAPDLYPYVLALE
jgi:DAK2 domain fusion protein YloV